MSTGRHCLKALTGPTPAFIVPAATEAQRIEGPEMAPMNQVSHLPRNARHATFVGSTTAGANGAVTESEADHSQQPAAARH